MDILDISDSGGDSFGSGFLDSGDLCTSNLEKSREEGAFASYETGRLIGGVSCVGRQAAAYDPG